ncbi:hypothetical protein CSA56_11745 [candidate division KSB3 bacterium]|uniref:Tripartite ATP-independent periplasmic transporters DctQ component domain-containing protein n=1 Tax=candidate division KSB3 bacterium TaxID=2044937 RepID=A0A2G6KCT7_9BACT|nr:MAG: hypothetical protein CSA56_11745 [candidate division KSB3 bacterium]
MSANLDFQRESFSTSVTSCFLCASVCLWQIKRSMGKKNKKFRIDEWIAAILLFAMATIAFVNVLSRYFFHFSFAATEEITINFFVWLTLVGTGIAFERSSQVGMVTVFKLFPKPMKKAIVWLSAVLGTGLFLLVDYFMLQTIYSEITLFQSTSPALGIPMITYYLGVPLLSIFVFIGIYRGAATQLQHIEEKGL